MGTETQEGNRRRLVRKPTFVRNFEARLGSSIPIHPNIISTFKLLLTPFVLAIQSGAVEVGPKALILVALFACFAACDYLDGVVARAQGFETWFGRFWDRACDYPLLIGVSYFSFQSLPQGLLVAKLVLDGILLLLFLMDKGSTENRIRTTMSVTTLLALLLVAEGVGGKLITRRLVSELLVVNILFTATVALYHLRILQKRFIADALSMGNLLCGIFSMLAASRGRVDISLLLLLIGGALDGVDGAAARRWGGTRFGVYSDDIADGVNYGIAPGVALYFALSGTTGIVLGGFYAMFTISRLVFFTLNKEGSDPNYFSGVPSTIGGIMTLCALMAFPKSDALLGFVVGLACLHMVSFDALHRHLGRALFEKPARAAFALPIAILFFVLYRFVGQDAAALSLLGICLIYAFAPTIRHFVVVTKTDRK